MVSYRCLRAFFLLLLTSLITPTTSSSIHSNNSNNNNHGYWWETYKSCLSKKPLLTKSVTSSVIMSISDLMCQRFEQYNSSTDRNDNSAVQKNKNTDSIEKNHDNDRNSLQTITWRRTLDVGITGLTYSGPISHTWYAILEYLVTSNDKLVALLTKMILDAFIFSPVAVAGYFTWRTVLEGGGPNDVMSKLQSKFIGTLLASLKFWPGVNIIGWLYYSSRPYALAGVLELLVF